MKTKEFEWNKLSRQDYLYFLNARIIAHLDGFFQAVPLANLFYLSLKTNGDVNAVMITTKEKIIEQPLYVERGLWKIIPMIQDRVLKDVSYGGTDTYCYILKYKKSYHLFYRIKLNKTKSKRKVLSLLKKYRGGKVKSKLNVDFNMELEKASFLNPKKIFKNKQLWAGLKYKEAN